ncbi:MAG: hypothetical protein ACLRWL_04180 [Evtepia gabavorous]
MQAAFPDYAVDDLPPLSICCHTGEGAVGVACTETLVKERSGSGIHAGTAAVFN